VSVTPQEPTPTAADVAFALTLFDKRWSRYSTVHGTQHSTLAQFAYSAADDEAIELLESAIDLIRLNRDRWEALSKRLEKRAY
jgi:hypothetical protein